MRIQLALVLVLALSVDVAADPIGMTQVHSPGQLVGSLVVEDFEDDVFVPGIHVDAPQGVQRVSASAAASEVTPSGAYGLIPDTFPAAIDISFAGPASSVGMFFGNDDTCCSSGFTAFLDAFAGDTLLGSVSVQANMNDFADQFIGFTTSEAVSRVRIRFGSGDVALFTYIDDVYVNASAATVPEPATWVLLLSGAGLAAARRRRAREQPGALSR